MNFITLLMLLPVILTGCSAAFEIADGLNKTTTGIRTDPDRFLWSKDTDASKSAPAATTDLSADTIAIPKGKIE